MKTKDTNLRLKDLDEKNLKVQIYVSSFGNVDSDGDIILPGAFKKTITEKGPSGSNRIKHLKQHDAYSVVGKPLEIIEDAKGLLVTSQISNSTMGKDLIEDYKLDLYEHSIGFEVVKGESSSDGYKMFEINLWEYSSVTWGANSKTPLVGFKALTKKDAIEELNNRMNKVVNAIRKGKYSDDRFEALEIELKYIQSAYNDLLAEPSVDTQPEPLQDTQQVDLAEIFFKHLIK
jgi:HK97 family phage prohead protease